MIAKHFLNSIANSTADVVQLLLDILENTNSKYCVIGGLAVNAYADPVVSLDLDLVIATDNIDEVSGHAEVNGFKVEAFEHSINLSSPNSDIRIQIQTDRRYQDFIARSEVRNILGYELRAASLKDVLQGKIWAYSDKSRRKSKRQKDLADIARLIEADPEAIDLLPDEVRRDVENI